MGYPPALDAYRTRVEEALARVTSGCGGPAGLVAAMEWSLLAGGKRLRPVMLLATRDLFPPGGLDPMPAACALELIHTYSLIHDDLPALDNDDFRRGRPSCHKRFGEAAALLAGDALLTDAFRLVGDAWRGSDDPAGLAVVAEIAGAAGSAGMVGGQVLDTIGTGRALTADELHAVHRGKTGAMIRAAVRCGAILGHAQDDELAALTSAAERLGLAFQVVDDVLDVTASAGQLGKTPGKDREQGKTTFASLLGVDGAGRYARELSDGAIDDLRRFGPAADPLRDLADFFVTRNA
ncbi:MAG: polyprenyl synthetase family protein [Deltaproteobacteria bacterium]|nr:polyprenyl synthetase family protein [Deltaproteobacteria bacterium]